MPDYLPKFKPGAAVTFTATADVTGGRLVDIGPTNRSCTPSGADSAKVLGIAAVDTPAGERTGVYLRPSGVHPLVAAGAIAAGARVTSAAAGMVQTIGAGLNPIGIAIEPATAYGDVVDVLFI